MIPRRVRLAVLIAFVGHGLFILTARYRLSYDAYTHMLFANHYAQDWFSLWEARWYAGFTVVSYPPLAHQLIALFIPLLGFEAAYALVLWAVTAAYPLGVYAFSRVFTGRSAASLAALASALLLPIYVTAHIFGQLPFLTGTLFALLGAAALARYLREGTPLDLALAVCLAATTMASHHATLLVQPFFALAVAASRIEKSGWRIVAGRLAIFGALAIAAGLLVVWPFWQWGLGQTMQTPIDHPSRHNLLTDLFAQAIFFWPLYGPLVALIPSVSLKWAPRFWGLRISFVVLFLLGLGGTTPLPALLFGKEWAWLTYDRFAFWASLTLTPFFGMVFILLRRKLPFAMRLPPAIPARTAFRLFTFPVFAATALLAWLAPVLLPIQPAPIAMKPITDFLDEDDRSQWRYLTFGFGDQFAHLNLLTKATTIDGSYHTARTIPELRRSGIGAIDTTFWISKDMTVLDPILEKAGDYGVRWGFVNRREYIPELLKNGWLYRWTLSNDVQVWENPAAVLPGSSGPPPSNPLASFSWGTLPLLALLTTGALALVRLRPAAASEVLLGIQTIAVGLLPIGLTFWYYRPLTAIEYPLVYFTYDNALFFLSDGLAFLAVWSWALRRTFASPPPADADRAARSSFRRPFSSAGPWLLGLCLLASLSVLWSQDRRVPLYASLQLWLVFGLFLALRDQPRTWRAFALGSCAALVLQVFFGFWQFAVQSTAFMAPLGLQWPAALQPALRGVSVVELLDGTRLLRVYGSLPHPNILGGLVIGLLPGPTLLFMARERRDFRMPVLFGLALVLLVLTFSRAAWIGLAVATLIVILRRQGLDRKRLLALGAAGSIGLFAALIPLRQYILVRVTDAPVFSEQSSREMRVWLAERSLEVIRGHPWLGVGFGSYTVASAGGLSPQSLGVGADFLLEPVHNVLLLAQAELGVAGTLLMLGLGVTVLLGAVRARRLEAVILASALAGMAALAMFDHFPWTLAPGRLMVGLLLGLWAAQAGQDGQ
jgi:O-antigen ligase